MTRTRGFTLIELLIVVAVIAVLAAIAIPSYMNQVRKSRRGEAIALINTISLAEEQWRSNCPTYLQFGGSCPANPSQNFMAAPASSYYTFAITPAAPTATGYTITATPTGAQANDSQFGESCNPLTYASANGIVTKSSGNVATNTKCWGQ